MHEQEIQFMSKGIIITLEESVSVQRSPGGSVKGP